MWLRLWYKSLRPELQQVELERKSLETVATTLQEDLLAKRRQSENPQESEAPHQGALLEAVGSGDVLLTMKVFAFCYFWEKCLTGPSELPHQKRIDCLSPLGCASLPTQKRKGKDTKTDQCRYSGATHPPISFQNHADLWHRPLPHTF